MAAIVTGIREKVNPEPKEIRIPTPAGALLSLICRGDQTAIEAAKSLVIDDFIKSDRIVFEGFLAVQERSIVIDEITMKNELPPGTDGGSALYRLLRIEDNFEVDPAKAGEYVVCIREAAQKRRQLEAVAGLHKAVKDGEGQTTALAALHDSMASATTTGGPIGDAMKAVMKHIQERQRGEGPAGIPTGLLDLDKRINGFKKGNLIILAARPGAGKTALALNLAEHNAINAGEKVPVLVFSLEMSREELTERLLAAQSGVDSQKFNRPGALQDSDWPKLTAASGRIYDAPLFIDDSGKIDINELCARAMKWHREQNIGLIIVDYLQLVRSSGDTRQEEISEISRGLKALAKSLEIPIIALSQLNREVEKRADKRPMMSDLRESGAIEQDADIILFIYRESLYCDDCRAGNCGKGHNRDAEIIVGKMRNGLLGAVPALYFGETQQFRSRDWRADDDKNILNKQRRGDQQTNKSMPKDSQAKEENLKKMAADLGVEVCDGNIDDI